MKPEDDHYVLYTNSDMTTKLTEDNVDWFESNDNILSKYENRMKRYKHTFKKNTNGTYYWYSTEPINK